MKYIYDTTGDRISIKHIGTIEEFKQEFGNNIFISNVDLGEKAIIEDGTIRAMTRLDRINEELEELLPLLLSTRSFGIPMSFALRPGNFPVCLFMGSFALPSCMWGSILLCCGFLSESLFCFFTQRRCGLSSGHAY